MRKVLHVAAAIAAMLVLPGCDISELIRYPGLVSGTVVIGPPPGRQLTLLVFLGSQSGETITVSAGTVQVQTYAQEAPFTIIDVWAGTYSVFAWEDANSNSTVDPGEWFGRTDGVVVRNGRATPGVVVSVSQYSGVPIRVRR